MMMDSDNILTISEAQSQGISKIVSNAKSGRRIVVTRQGHPAAAVVDIETLDRLQRVEEIEENARLMALVLARMVTDNGHRTSLDDVLKELGIEED